jgi:hypothetical protein
LGIRHFGFQVDSVNMIEESPKLLRKRIPLELLRKVGSAILKVTGFLYLLRREKKYFKEDGVRKVSNGVSRSDLGFRWRSRCQ